MERISVIENEQHLHGHLNLGVEPNLISIPEAKIKIETLQRNNQNIDNIVGYEDADFFNIAHNVFCAPSEIRKSNFNSFTDRIKRRYSGKLSVFIVEQIFIHEAKKAQSNVTNISSAFAVTDTERDVLKLIEIAYQKRASDIHINLQPEQTIIRFRIDGFMQKIHTWTNEKGNKFLRALHTMKSAGDSNYNPNSYMACRVDATDYEGLPPGLQALRLQYNPDGFNSQHCVIRLLGQGYDGDLLSMGYSKAHLKDLDYLQSVSSGVIIISGPTGSGKSTTLQKVLERIYISNLNQNREKNIITIEDPPEYKIKGATQFPVANAETSEERNRAFTKTMLAALRSDPDYLMIGEIRDKEAAKLMLEASLTGHPVWTTLHANSALGNVDRLLKIGIEKRNLSNPDYFKGFIAQRLLRKLCPNCSIEMSPDETLSMALECHNIEIPKKIKTPDHQGCKLCTNGYKGRTLVAEICITNAKLLDIHTNESSQKAQSHWINNDGGKSIYHHALTKISEGITDVEEVINILGPIPR